jgi:FkbM family methyltransferase
MAAKKPQKVEIVAQDGPTEETVLDRTEKMLGQAGKLLSQMQASTRFNSAMRADGTCPIFYQDVVQHIALPWADFELSQMQLLARRAPKDDVFLRQLFDLVPSLEGKALIDVGSFTGVHAMMLRAFLKPKETHMFEPQKTMKEALETTIAVNGAGKDVTLHTDVIDEDGQDIVMSAYRPDRLSEATYLRRADGPLKSKSIDSLKIKKVGCLCLEFNNSKVNALRGAEKTLIKDRPVITLDLTARDIDEVRAFLEPHNYEDIRAGQHSIIFLPK